MQYFKRSINSNDLRDSPKKNHFRFQTAVFDEQLDKFRMITIEAMIGMAEPEIGIDEPYVYDWEVVRDPGDAEIVPAHILSAVETNHREASRLCNAALKVFIREHKQKEDQL